MSHEIHVTIVPRPQFRDYLMRAERFACVAAHRRAGKTYACIQDLIARALTHKRDGPPLRYAYVAPTRDQAKDVAWPYMLQFTQEIPGVVVNRADLSLTLPNGSSIRLYSGESFDRMRGIYLDGVVIDEPADIDPDAWPFVIRPCLSDYQGFCTFIGTPKGKDAFYQIWKNSITDPEWFSMTLKASDSGIIPEEELRGLRANMTEGAFRQEYLVDWSAPIPNAIYAACIDAARAEGRIAPMPQDPNHLVHVVFDLGAPAQTVCFYFQIIGKTIRIIDVDMGGEETIIQRVARMRSMGYPYGAIFFPHDALTTERSGRTLATEFAAVWLNQNLEMTGIQDYHRANLKFIPRTHDIFVGINRAIQLFPIFEFRSPQCDAALDMIGRYRTRPMKEGVSVTPEPIHDSASHASDCLRYIAEAELAGMIPFKAPVEAPEWTYMDKKKRQRGQLIQRVGG